MRRKSPPDDRPKWDDPSLPCVRPYKFANGKTTDVVDADYESRYRAHLMETAAAPNWRDDPTYHMKRKPNA